ncbi:metacaspase-3-like isoform X2 [Actinidia eriantha]|uniref:metacaspase-3-like isoform X2 n=1 Tax=Actinidia eriantha TaxID=165200 RepID=UPI00258E8FAE|nr:metacaspase-3-like isoform X2 [Actinidia eriantha]
MESIVCSNCNSQVLGTPFSVNYRCRSCQAMISTQQCETLSKGALRLHLMTRFYRSRNPSSMSPKPNQKPNPVSFAAGHQQKKALLCGVSYEKKNHKLKGTVNDVNRMKCLLVDLYGFPVNAIHVLTEEKNNTDLSPTKKNIQKALSWLVEDCKSGDSLVFYFSGHGLRQPDFNGDELDGKRWEDNKPPSGARKCTNGGLAISLSACADDQMAADTAAFTGNEMSGALTYIFVQTIRENPQITYGDLLNEMKEKMELANRKGCLNSPFLKKLFHCNLMQECQLSSSKEFDVNAEQFNI